MASQTQKFVVTELVLGEVEVTVVGDFDYEVDNGVIFLDDVRLDRIVVLDRVGIERVPSDRLKKVVHAVVECVLEEWDGGQSLGTGPLELSALAVCQSHDWFNFTEATKAA